jgi:Fe-S cluster biosynthesis and repair protein YggX
MKGPHTRAYIEENLKNFGKELFREPTAVYPFFPRSARLVGVDNVQATKDGRMARGKDLDWPVDLDIRVQASLEEANKLHVEQRSTSVFYRVVIGQLPSCQAKYDFSILLHFIYGLFPHVPARQRCQKWHLAPVSKAAYEELQLHRCQLLNERPLHSTNLMMISVLHVTLLSFCLEQAKFEGEKEHISTRNRTSG